MMSEIIIEARDVFFTYDGDEKASLQGVNIAIKKGNKVAFMGANGSGKSTFFLCLNGVHKPDAGSIFYRGKPVDYSKAGLKKLRGRVGIVFQDPDNQLFSASVTQEISFGILNMGVPENEAKAEVERVIERMEITPFKDRPTYALSGGQKKQVSIADILVMHPEVIILDEPTGALDPKHTKLVNDWIDRLSSEGITILQATHDIDYACAWADEIVLMKDGKVLKQGTPQEICADKETLALTNLEEPAVYRIYRKLCEKGILKPEETMPESLQKLIDML